MHSGTIERMNAIISNTVIGAESCNGSFTSYRMPSYCSSCAAVRHAWIGIGRCGVIKQRCGTCHTALT
jgi:hypothetical protein